jgi:hypothetical protein
MLSSSQIAALKAAFIDAGFLNWGKGFDCFEQEDHRTTFISFRDGRRRHEIKHYEGCRSKKGVDPLKRLETVSKTLSKSSAG